MTHEDVHHVTEVNGEGNMRRLETPQESLCGSEAQAVIAHLTRPLIFAAETKRTMRTKHPRYQIDQQLPLLLFNSIRRAAKKIGAPT